MSAGAGRTMDGWTSGVYRRRYLVVLTWVAIVSLALELALSEIVLALMVKLASSVIAAASTGAEMEAAPVALVIVCAWLTVTETERPDVSVKLPANSTERPSPSAPRVRIKLSNGPQSSSRSVTAFRRSSPW